MATTNEAPRLERRNQAGSLNGVLEQSETVKELVQECVRELSAVNAAFKDELDTLDSLPGIEGVLEMSEAVEGKVKEACERLSLVNRALKGEVRGRRLVDHQLAAALEQREGALQASLHDVLTGLPNRALFMDRLEHGISLAKRLGWSLAVMFVDLDEFKAINDTLGHEAGDRVLRTIAARLKDNFRGQDTVGRLGGDEFLCLLMDVRGTSSIESIAEQLIGKIQVPCGDAIPGTDGGPSVKASIGIAMFPANATSSDQLVARADEAMYRAKKSRSGYSFAHQEP